MNIQAICKYFARALFLLASASLVVAFLELIAQFLGTSLIAKTYTPGRLIELSAALIVFVIAVLLRQIRDELRTNRGN